jgi:hypothetical protein
MSSLKIARASMLDVSHHLVGHGWAESLFKAMSAGYLIAAMVWHLHVAGAARARMKVNTRDDRQTSVLVRIVTLPVPASLATLAVAAAVACSLLTELFFVHASLA